MADYICLEIGKRTTVPSMHSVKASQTPVKTRNHFYNQEMIHSPKPGTYPSMAIALNLDIQVCVH